jgi:hypothetical protein
MMAVIVGCVMGVRARVPLVNIRFAAVCVGMTYACIRTARTLLREAKGSLSVDLRALGLTAVLVGVIMFAQAILLVWSPLRGGELFATGPRLAWVFLSTGLLATSWSLFSLGLAGGWLEMKRRSARATSASACCSTSRPFRRR